MDLGYSADQSVLVTGGSRGIGAAVVHAIANEGVGLIHVVGRDEESLARLSREVNGADVVGHALDLSRPADRNQLAEVVRDVDILVNNAGSVPQGGLVGADLGAWRESWDLKVWGYLDLMDQAVTAMSVRGSGVVVNVIGVAGQRPDAGYIAGTGANAALIGVTLAVGAYSIDQGVRVVGVNPGATATSRITHAFQLRAAAEFGDAARADELIARLPAKRLARPAEIADAVVFLASPRSSYTSGEIVTVDGGQTGRGGGI